MKKLKEMTLLALAALALAAGAMPSAEQLAAARGVVAEFMAPELKALRAKAKTPAEVGEAACALAGKAEGEAAKWLLLTEAVRHFARTGESIRVVEALNTLRKSVRDVPDAEIRKLLVEAVKLAPKSSAEPLNAVGREVESRLRAAAELERAKSALREHKKRFPQAKVPASVYRRIGDCQAVLDDWDAALQAYRRMEGPVADAAKAELKQAWPVEKFAEFWWTEAERTRGSAVKTALFRKSASFYADAVGSGALTGLYKERAEKRIAEIDEKYTLEGLFAVAAKYRKAGETKTVTLPGGAKLELVWCPPCPKGFMMGCEGSENAPLHKVKLTKGFWIGKYEVTQAQWKSVMGDNPSMFIGDDLPVEKISWNACQKFCRKSGLDFRLPTEAEWEYACRAGTTGDFAGEVSEMAWYVGTAKGHTHDVGTKKSNPWGIFDMHGNVWEWCQDYWRDGYPNGEVIDPVGPVSGQKRVLRGGSWYNYDYRCNSFDRCYRGMPNDTCYGKNIFGFRVCLNSEDYVK